jgi:diguanylate cyclase (GGDEF)-like protein/hemerythrin-like metal-binding protein/PAS domain S-box-containing protein
MTSTSIDIFPWNDSFDTGIHIIDQQHRQLINLLNKLTGHLAFFDDAFKLNQIITELSNDTVYYFDTEESIWADYLKDDSLEVQHQRSHASFIEKIEELKAIKYTVSSDVAEEILAFLTQWLASHILQSDQHMACIVIACQKGIDLEAAKELAKQQMLGTSSVDLILSIYSSLSFNTLRLMRELNEHRKAEAALKKESAKNIALLHNSSDGIYVVDLSGNIIEVSDPFCTMLGYQRTDILRKNINNWDAQFTAVELLEQIQRQYKSQKPTKYESLFRLLDTKIIHVEITGYPLDLDNIPAMFYSARDITERKKIEQALHENEQRLRLAMSVTKMGVWEYNFSDDRLYWSPELFMILGVPPFEPTLEKFQKIVHPDDLDAVLQEMNEAAIQHRPFSIDYRFLKGDGSIGWIADRAEFQFDKSGNPIKAIGTAHDITDKKLSEEQLWQQANYDPLTGLPNRRLFYNRLEQEINDCQRNKKSFALFFLDLDRLKDVNDSLGHALGDELLKESARRLLNCFKDKDSVSRLGGDEFTIIIGELYDASYLDKIAAKFLSALCEPYHFDEEILYISASIGISVYPNDTNDQGLLIKYADQALYAAKSQGSNQYCFFAPYMQSNFEHKHRLIKDLRVALQLNQFEVYFQPIVDFYTGKINKAEALIRWHHPSNIMISPSEFIPIAEETGMIHEIGDFVFNESIKFVAEIRQHYLPNFQVSINKSPVQFQSTNSCQIYWPDQLYRLGLSNDCIVVEITEGLLLDEAKSTSKDKLLRFRDVGIQVAIDDFGTGYSALSYLQKFDIDYIKIDQSFIRNLQIGSNELALCEAIVVMAHKLSIKVIAEGVETQSQCDLLKEIGCDFGQGYYWSKPIPKEKFIAECIEHYDIATLNRTGNS